MVRLPPSRRNPDKCTKGVVVTTGVEPVKSTVVWISGSAGDRPLGEAGNGSSKLRSKRSSKRSRSRMERWSLLISIFLYAQKSSNQCHALLNFRNILGHLAPSKFVNQYQLQE